MSKTMLVALFVAVLAPAPLVWGTDTPPAADNTGRNVRDRVSGYACA